MSEWSEWREGGPIVIDNNEEADVIWNPNGGVARWRKRKRPSPSTVDEIRKRLQFIEDIKGDDERAHGAEDDLWEEVLQVIADGVPNPQELAREALETKKIDFARWCA